MIKLTHINKAFGKKVALRGVSFIIQRGEILGLLGHNGAGKTTSLRLIATLLDPDGGSIDVIDPDVSDTHKSAAFKASFGFLPDEPFLFEYLTGVEMLQFLGTLYSMDKDNVRSRAESLLDLFELRHVSDQLIRGYSRGMRRKLSIVGSILHDPLYWVLDEPTEALDPIAIRAIKGLAREQQRRGRSVVISTHQLALAEGLCDRLVILHKGQVLFDGTMEDLRRATGCNLATLEDIYYSLFRGAKCTDQAG